MLAVPTGINNKTGKVYYTFREKFIDSGQLSEVKLMPDGKYYAVKAVPCGKCIGCRLDYAKQWSIRCALEMQEYPKEECAFVTLTYDDAHLPAVFVQDGKVVGKQNMDNIEQTFCFVQQDVVKNATLYPPHLKEFLKRLRSKQNYDFGKKFRFYACGEYGSKNFRPHYHLILFGVKLPEPEPGAWRKQVTGYQVYESKYLEKIWHNQGNVIVGSCTYESIGYVARYMLKKQKGDDRFKYDELRIVPPFTRMSLKPGIGLRYYDQHQLNIYSDDMIYIGTEKRGIKARPPRYFDKKFQEEYPDLFNNLKEVRCENALNSMLAKEMVSGKPISEVLKDEEENVKARTKILHERNVEK